MTKNNLRLRTILFFAAAAAVFLAFRWFEVYYNNGYYHSMGEEELIYSTIAAERVRGNTMVDGMMFQEYTSGGYLLQTYLYQPFVRSPACTRNTLKWVPILFSCAGFMAYLFLARIYFGRKSSWLFALFMTLGVPLLSQHQIIGFANHNESHVFISPCLLIIFWYLFGRSRSISLLILTSFFLGLWSALGVLYCYSVMPFVFFWPAPLPSSC